MIRGYFETSNVATFHHTEHTYLFTYLQNLSNNRTCGTLLPLFSFLFEEEVLAKVIPTPIKTDIPYSLIDEEFDDISKYIDGDKKEFKKVLKQLAANNTRNILIIDKLKELEENGKKILYFRTDKTQSILVFAALQKLGVSSIVL